MTWVPDGVGSGFDADHLPYGVVMHAGTPRIAVRVGRHALDLRALSEAGTIDDPDGTLRDATLNRFLAAGPTRWAATRARITELVSDQANRAAVEPALLPLDTAEARLPITIGDYVDFYSSLDHATNLGRLFRPDSEPLLPNWRHLPVAYHGRSGTVVVSGTTIRRPWGQRKGPQDPTPVFGPSARLDIEAEVGFVVGVPTPLGRPIAANAFADHVFGVALVNDWSARDIQSWEYQPLGPFLGKSFATTISAWITPLAALAGARVAPPAQDPEPLPYLADDDPWSLDLRLEVEVNGEVVSRPPFAGTYWTPGQQLAHMTVNGASVRAGDLFASGTVSGPEPGDRGSFIELTWNGTDPLRLADGSTRTFLEDGDRVVLRATAPTTSGGVLSLGEAAGAIAPAR